MQSQLQSFESVRASFGSQMDLKMIQKGKVCWYRSFHKLVCIRCEQPVFLDCAPLFIVTGETVF